MLAIQVENLLLQLDSDLLALATLASLRLDWRELRLKELMQMGI
jgi:hypothetical protein